MVSVRDRKKSDNTSSASKPQEPCKSTDQTSVFSQYSASSAFPTKSKEAESLQAHKSVTSPNHTPFDTRELQDAYATVKQQQEQLRALKRHTEDLGFLLEQVHSKVDKIAGCFDKLGGSWSKPTLQNPDSLSQHPAELASAYASIKLLFFQWGQSLETGKNLLKRQFTDLAERTCAELSEVKKVLKPLKDSLQAAETPKRTVQASDLVFMECVRARQIEAEAVGVWKTAAHMLVLGLLGHDPGARGIEQLRTL